MQDLLRIAVVAVAMSGCSRQAERLETRLPDNHIKDTGGVDVPSGVMTAGPSCVGAWVSDAACGDVRVTTPSREAGPDRDTALDSPMLRLRPDLGPVDCPFGASSDDCARCGPLPERAKLSSCRVCSGSAEERNACCRRLPTYGACVCEPRDVLVQPGPDNWSWVVRFCE